MAPVGGGAQGLLPANMTPRGVQPFWGLWGGGGGDPSPPPWLTQTLGVSGLGGQPPGSPGGGGGCRWVPQHIYLKMIPMTR